MWLYGLMALVILVVGLALWWRARAAQRNPPPELDSDEPPPPQDRDPTWDPRERYED